MLLELGYSEEDVVVYHFRVPGEDLMVGLRPLGNNTDFIRLLQYVKTNKELDVYIQHVRKNPKQALENDEREPEYVDSS
ncbi:hypothetical protein Hanom_Chr06g00524731 [Helianthus anomalus]